MSYYFLTNVCVCVMATPSVLGTLSPNFRRPSGSQGDCQWMGSFFAIFGRIGSVMNTRGVWVGTPTLFVRKLSLAKIC